MKKTRFFSALLCIALMLSFMLPRAAAQVREGGAQEFTLYNGNSTLQSVQLGEDSIILSGTAESDGPLRFKLTVSDRNDRVVYSQKQDQGSDGRTVFSRLSIAPGQYTVRISASQDRQTYSSSISHSFRIDWDGHCGTVVSSPVAGFNDTSSERCDEIALAYYLRPAAGIQSDDPEIRSLAASLTALCDTDTEKALAIHDWVCDNIYYDYDVYYKRTERGDCSALDVLQTRRTVCTGYANLTAALLKAAGIPARTVSGYALGLSAGPEFPQDVIEGGGKSNHAWNMAFIDGEWTYIDSTWDSGNKWEHGRITDNKGCYRHTYFMITGDLLAENHAVMISNSFREIQLYVDYPAYWDGTDWRPLGNAAPMIVNGTAMVPLRSVIEGMGGTVVYDAQSDPNWEKITCTMGHYYVQMWIGYGKYYVDGEEHTFKTAPCVVNGHTVIPVREVLEAMGLDVIWEDHADNWAGRITIRGSA